MCNDLLKKNKKRDQKKKLGELQLAISLGSQNVG